MSDYNGLVIREQGGGKLTVLSGGEIEIQSGGVLDVQAGATYTNAKPFTHRIRTKVFNLDNGAGTTIDDIVMKPAAAITITAGRIVYTEATDAAGVTAGNIRIGTTVGGEEIVTASGNAYAQPKAIGSETALVITAGAVAAGTLVCVRHTGVVATPIAGEAFVELEYTVNP